MTKIEKYYSFRRLGKKPAYVSKSEDINLYDFVFYDTEQSERKRTEFQKATQKPRKKETQAAKQIQIGEIDPETGEVTIFSKSPKSEMNVYLRSEDGEKYHVTGRGIFVHENDVRQIVRKARKLRGKRAIRTLALVWKGKQKRKNERQIEHCDDVLGFDPLNALNRDFSGILEAPTPESPPENVALLREKYMLENALRERESLAKIYEKSEYRGAFSLQWRAFSGADDIPASIENIDREIELRREIISRLEKLEKTA